MQELFNKFETFAVPDLPHNESAVYVVVCVKGNKEIPIYVGETINLRKRIFNEISAYFKQRTDFKVGEAIRYLQGKGYKVVIKHKKASGEPKIRKEEQNRIIENLCGEGYELLNHGLKYYDPTNPDIEGTER